MNKKQRNVEEEEDNEIVIFYGLLCDAVNS
jgi:hypothetical protein